MDSWREGHRMRKKKWQMEILREKFNEEPVWSYHKKM